MGKEEGKVNTFSHGPFYRPKYIHAKFDYDPLNSVGGVQWQIKTTYFVRLRGLWVTRCEWYQLCQQGNKLIYTGWSTKLPEKLIVTATAHTTVNGWVKVPATASTIRHNILLQVTQHGAAELFSPAAPSDYCQVDKHECFQTGCYVQYRSTGFIFESNLFNFTCTQPQARGSQGC